MSTDLSSHPAGPAGSRTARHEIGERSRVVHPHHPWDSLAERHRADDLVLAAVDPEPGRSQKHAGRRQTRQHRVGLLEALAEQTSSPLTLGRLPHERFDPKVEAAAYFVVAETLKRTRPRRAAIDAAPADGRLVVEVQTDQQPPRELTDLEDRVGALDGRLFLEHGLSGGTRIRAELPCG